MTTIEFYDATDGTVFGQVDDLKPSSVIVAGYVANWPSIGDGTAAGFAKKYADWSNGYVSSRATATKAAKPVAAGIAVQARDTGRILMLQRADDDEDPAAGLWEFPGGCAESEDGGPFGTATREWQEETGVRLPDGEVTGSYTSPDGKYVTFIYEVSGEIDVPIFTDRDQVVNPDDPDGDAAEALAWWEQSHLDGNPAVRPEVRASVSQLTDRLAAVKGLSPAIIKLADQLHKAGNPQALRSWYASGGGGKINWGGEGDLTACHALASRHMSSEQAWGFCQERAREAMGHYNKPND